MKPCSTTGIGSLPFTTVAEALAHVFSHYDIPFLPQLPKVSKREGMLAQSFEDFSVSFSALPAFLKQNRKKIIKLQITGPVTLAEHLFIDHPEMVERLISFLTRKTEALIEQFDGTSRILFLFDEPALTEKNAAMVFGGLERMVDVLSKKRHVLFGLHSCNRWSGPLFSAFFKSSLKLLSLDMLLNSDALLADAKVVETWMAYLKKGWMIWGLAPTAKSVKNSVGRPSDSLITRFKNKGLQNKKIVSILERSLLSPACGTALLSVARERACAAQLKKSAQHLRRIINSEA